MKTRNAVVMTADFQTREVDGNLYIDGYFAVFGGQYWLWDEAYETIDAGAFDLDADKDVRALTNHDTTLVLGRTTAGTLDLRVDERGLYGTITINKADQDAVNLYERVKRGDVSQCSFGFEILDEWMERVEGMPTVWHLRKVRLFEIHSTSGKKFLISGIIGSLEPLSKTIICESMPSQASRTDLRQAGIKSQEL